MPNFKKITPKEATGEVAEIFKDFMDTLGVNFIPNFFQTLAANSLNVLRGTWAVYKNVNWKGVLPPPLKEMLFTAIATDRDCRYCEAAHLAFCTALEVDPLNLNAIVSDVDAINPPKTRSAVKFAIECSRNPLNVDQAKCDELRKVGFSDGEIIELIAMVSFSLYAINLADAMKLEIDEDFIQILGGRAPQKAR